MKKFEPKTYFLRLRPEFPEVPGLFLVGNDVLCDSVVACATSGLLCASKVLGKGDPYSLLHKLPQKASQKGRVHPTDEEAREEKLPGRGKGNGA
jgi:hypothetical protein